MTERISRFPWFGRKGPKARYLLTVALLAWAAVAAFGQAGSTVLPSPVTVTDPSWKSSAGRPVAFERDGSAIALYNPDGTLASEYLARLPEGLLLRVTDVALSGDGRLAACGEWTMTNFGFLLFDGKGNAVSVADTYPFLPRKMAFGPGGDPWLFGSEQSPAGNRPACLRRYRTSGELIASVKLPVALATRRVRPAYFNASNERVGLWFRQFSLWLEYDAGGKLAYQARLSSPDGAIVLADSGEIYGWKDGLVRFDRRTRQWVRAAGVVPDRYRDLSLFGEAGPVLLFRIGSEDPPELIRFRH